MGMNYNLNLSPNNIFNNSLPVNITLMNDNECTCVIFPNCKKKSIYIIIGRYKYTKSLCILKQQ